MSKRSARLLRRVQRVKAAEGPFSRLITTFGNLVERLPRDYVGERHEVISKRLGFDERGNELLEWKEVAGPDPEREARRHAGPDPDVDEWVHVLNVIYVKPWPYEERYLRLQETPHSNQTLASD